MLYIDRIVLHNFKSFRHASIAFRKNFNCIVGPNGSGKSNVCDSLLFALGESSLRRLRIVSPTQLLNEDVKKGKNEEMRRAYVKVIMGGDANVEIIRYAREDRKMGYRLNGKHTTKQDVVEFLRGHGGDVNETNTIAQGEIVRILNMNSKERREIIDVAAGINEFDKKKEAAERELERVEERLGEAHGMLNERKGFLKELKKEK
ncbi:MAG: AAA family ATPase, partial [Candidatus Marsarchaeota archaeon]|nr:AAA family ATPase [Candidatus Marsarchaeota archaeon]